MLVQTDVDNDENALCYKHAIVLTEATSYMSQPPHFMTHDHVENMETWTQHCSSVAL